MRALDEVPRVKTNAFAEVKMSIQASVCRLHSAAEPKELLQNKTPKG